MARDELVNLAERARVIRGLAMVDRAQHQIGRAFQRRAVRCHTGRRARLADEAAIGLRKFVVAVAAQRKKRRAWRDFALALVQSAQERAAAIELAAEAFVPLKDAVVGNAAQHGMAHVCTVTVPDDVADRIAAARIAYQRHARRAGAAFQFLDGLRQLAPLIFGR
jgi:hypothetical protein